MQKAQLLDYAVTQGGTYWPQEVLLTVLREWTRAYGALLLLLDDFDRADALSWLLLAQVAEQPDMAVLVVAAYRPNDGIFATPGIGQVFSRHHHDGLMQCLWASHWWEPTCITNLHDSHVLLVSLLHGDGDRPSVLCLAWRTQRVRLEGVVA